MAASRLRPGPEAGSRRRRSLTEGHHPRRPRPVHLGRHRQVVLRNHAGDHQARRGMAGANIETAGVRRPGVEPLPAEERAPWPRLMPLLRGKISRGRVQAGSLRRQRRRAGIRLQRRPAPLAALGTSCPDHFLRTKIRPLVLDFDPPRRTSTPGEPVSIRRWKTTAPTTPPTTSAASAPTARSSARRQSDHLPDPWRGHAVLRQGQGHGAHRRRVLRQRDQRDARRERRRHLCRPAGTGSLRHRILAAGRSQAAAHAEAEKPGRPHRAGHRRRRRHRPGGGETSCCRKALA
jgi:hypothetical protein